MGRKILRIEITKRAELLKKIQCCDWVVHVNKYTCRRKKIEKKIQTSNK